MDYRKRRIVGWYNNNGFIQTKLRNDNIIYKIIDLHTSSINYLIQSAQVLLGWFHQQIFKAS